MQKIKTVAELKIAIQQLEDQQAKEWPELRKEFLTTVEGLKPLNVIKNTVKEFVSSPDLKGNLVGATMGVTAGYLSQALIVGVTHHPVKKLLGTIIQMGISNIISKHPEKIKSITGNIINFFNKKKENKTESI